LGFPTGRCFSLSSPYRITPIHLISVLGVLGTQETFCIIIAGLLERDSFDLLLPEFDKPWVIHLRETYCCSTNLCTWRPNTVYKNRSMCRHQLFRPEPRVDLSGRSPVVCKALDASIDARLYTAGIENSLSRARLMRLPGHLVLLTVDLSLYLTYDIRIGILPPKFG
jgi:hypothetical protein